VNPLLVERGVAWILAAVLALNGMVYIHLTSAECGQEMVLVLEESEAEAVLLEAARKEGIVTIVGRRLFGNWLFPRRTREGKIDLRGLTYVFGRSKRR
jgi:hypothetical protein